METNILEVFLGKERYEKEEKFSRALLNIEEENIEFFKKRPSNHINEEHDRLHDHWILIMDNDKVRFRFKNDKDLPIEIINKCYQKFKDIFDF